MAAPPERNPYEAPKAPIDSPPELPDRSASLRRAGPPGAAYEVDCPCGQTLGVNASQCGSAVICDCGKEVAVPSLSRLREASGRGRYESGPADTIRRMIETGELPAGTTCAYSRAATADVLDLRMVLPRFFRDDETRQQGLFLVGGALAVLIYHIFHKSVIEEEGAETLVAPLRIASRWHAHVAAMSQRRLKRLLRTVPIYAKLLDENPYARITVTGRQGEASRYD